MLQQLKEKIQSLGFLDSAVLPVTFLEEEEPRLKEWLKKGMHGEMGYMNKNRDKRLDPALLVNNAKTIIVVLLNYYPEQVQEDQAAPVLSKYAYGTDYHFVMKDKLKALLHFIQTEIVPCSGRPFVDSAPVLERAWAKKAGLGWVGKNSNLISPEYGSFFFIGELIIDTELPYDKPKPILDHCKRCTKCIDACPTKAIVADRVVDARKCISYQTIELRGEIDAELKGRFENRVFGCDICQDVCPWNLKSKPQNEPGLKPHPKLLTLQKQDWENMERPLFKELFNNSAVKRTGYKGLLRNLKFINEEK